MLYIKKKEAPRSMRAKVAEIKSSPAWKHIQLEDTKALRQQFDLLPKQDIRQALLDEQYFLCAYCMRRIENEELHMNIEHWSPLSKDKDNALNYRNFLAVCKGGADIPGNTKRRVLCCDAKKLDTELTIDPQDQEMMSHIRYNKMGSFCGRYCLLSAAEISTADPSKSYRLIRSTGTPTSSITPAQARTSSGSAPAKPRRGVS